MTIEGNPAFDRTACIIASDLAVIDASVQTQMSRHRRRDRRGLTRRDAMTAERFSIDDRLTSVLPSLYEKIRDSAPRSRKGRVRRLLGVIIHATASGARIANSAIWSTRKPADGSWPR